jgi:hypothetical protein
MRKFQNLSLLTLTLCLVMMVAGPSRAALVDTFTFSPTTIGFGNPTPPGWSVTGSFTIPASDFSAGGMLTLPNTDISALDFTLTYPGGSTVFNLADLSATGTITFDATSAPAVLSTATGFLVMAVNNAYISIGANAVPGAFAFVAVGSPTTTTDVYGHWNSAELSNVPEPSTWAMLIAGFGFLGWRYGLRRGGLRELFRAA